MQEISSHIKIEEVTSVLTPAEGITIEQALADANIDGYKSINIIDGVAYITWYKREEN